MRTLKLIAAVLTIGLSSGCGQYYFFNAYPGVDRYGSADSVYQPNADGPAATLGTSAIIPAQHIAYASSQSGAAGAFGPGTARFNGISLEAFSMDGELSATPPANAQAGFFLRPTTTSSSVGRGLFVDTLSDTVVAGADTLIAWGRWSDTTARLITRDNLVPLGEFFYVIGQSTPVARLPQSGLARYRYLGGDYENPFRQGNDNASAGLSVLWGSGTAKVGLAIDAGLGYLLATTGGVSDPSVSELSLRPGTATFGGVVPTTRGSNQFGRLPCGTCQGTVEGFFAGPDAERAGVSFQVIESGPSGTIASVSGAWAFELTALPAPVAPAPTPPPAPAFVPLDPAGPFDMARAGGPADATASLSSLGVMTQNQATGAIERFGQAAFTNELARGTAQSADVGGDALITWGRWTDGSYEQVQTFGNTPVALGAEQALHYVIGAATPGANIPASGTASFSLMGATKPTFGDGALAAGTLAGSMSVSWGGAAATKVGMDLTVTMPGDASYSVVTAGGLASPSLSQVQTFFGAQFFGTVPVASAGRACASNPGGCGANIAGFFAGPAAERAGIAYQLGSGNAQQSIHGAAAFKR
jgi:hypothetical protein